MKKINVEILIYVVLILFEKDLSNTEKFSTVVTRKEIIDKLTLDISPKTIQRYIGYIKNVFCEHDEFDMDIESSNKGYQIIRKKDSKPIK